MSDDLHKKARRHRDGEEQMTPHEVWQLACERDSAREAVRELMRERDELVETLAWIRRKLKLPEDAQMFSGSNTIAGAMNVMEYRAHGYMAYIEAFKCNDKQGEIARLTVAKSELVAALRPFADLDIDGDIGDALIAAGVDSDVMTSRAMVEKYGGSRD